jgi:hypothetical protein
LAGPLTSSEGHSQPSVLWSPETESPVYEFIAGIFATEDPELIKKMKGMGFVTEPIDARTQAALEITADLMKQAPPAPPNANSVPSAPVVKPQTLKPEPIEPGFLEPKTVRPLGAIKPTEKITRPPVAKRKPVEKK